MAEHLKSDLKSILIALMVLMLGQGVMAEELRDPTRPPVGIGQTPADAGVPAEPELQSILISPSRRIAIISGKTVQVGDKFGDARVAAINSSEVVLKTGKNLRVLKLYPSLHNQVTISHADSNVEVPKQSR
ncbi:MAG TPA: MSHA biogenesis protein MshK [Burkholderiaceae bacterium]|jgi:MSHA biogenesis protein MshK|nr:MSHA biogenesis protein MshK [Burkholderiaceae bacterium]